MKIERFLGKTKSPKFAALSEKFEQRSKDLIAEFEEKHKDALEYLEKKGIDADKILHQGSRKAVAGLAAAIVLLSSGISQDKDLNQQVSVDNSLAVNQIVGEITSKQDKSQALLKIFSTTLPKNVNHLSYENETNLSLKVSQTLGVKVTTELEGNRLNTNYGKIGLEQHLPRYPGDNMQEHFESGIASSLYGKSGLTRNRGAFGYFTNSKYNLTKEAIEKEKYYAVVQTFDIPGYNSKKAQWYKHRKVLIINTENGRSVVGAIADSGPAKWTGKSFGGSPELMDHLQMYRGSRKAKVLVFFIDESNGEVKLGPL